MNANLMNSATFDPDDHSLKGMGHGAWLYADGNFMMIEVSKLSLAF